MTTNRSSSLRLPRSDMDHNENANKTKANDKIPRAFKTHINVIACECVPVSVAYERPKILSFFSHSSSFCARFKTIHSSLWFYWRLKFAMHAAVCENRFFYDLFWLCVIHILTSPFDSENCFQTQNCAHEAKWSSKWHLLIDRFHFVLTTKSVTSVAHIIFVHVVLQWVVNLHQKNKASEKIMIIINRKTRSNRVAYQNSCVTSPLGSISLCENHSDVVAQFSTNAI